MRLNAISHVVLHVKNLGRASEFYTHTLGLQEHHRDPNWIEYRVGPCSLAIRANPDLPADRGKGLTEVAFAVDDAHKAYQSLKAKGVAFISEPQKIMQGDRHIGYAAKFRDPDGNVLAIYSHREG